MTALSFRNVDDVLEYNPTSGDLRWKPGTHLHGRVAGSVFCPRPHLPHPVFYIRVMIRRRSYFAHRLAVLLMTGDWPGDKVDHRDGDGLNNKWANIRDATIPQNSQNLTVRTSKSGMSGVSPNHKNWRAQIGAGGQTHYLGTYDSREDAYAAYLGAKSKLHAFQPIPRHEIAGCGA